MFWLKNALFELLEFGLGLRPYFAFKTRDPAFVNFRLSEAEAEAVRRALPAGFALRPPRLLADDEPAYWVGDNFYELRYPRPTTTAGTTTSRSSTPAPRTASSRSTAPSRSPRSRPPPGRPRPGGGGPARPLRAPGSRAGCA
jgi:hypothetical protein